jgi:hypothetical protein
MTKRIVVSLAAIGVLLALTASGQKLRPTQQLTVYDADGKKVGVIAGGDYTDSEFLPLVPFKVDDVPFMLLVFRDGFVGYRVVVWESANCSGTPFLTLSNPSAPSSLPRVGVGLPGSTVYVEDGPARTITAGSYSTYPFPGANQPPWIPSQCTRAQVFPWTAMAVPARALIDMDTLFKPPFTVR